MPPPLVFQLIDTKKTAIEGRMNCFVRTVAIIWTVLFALPETSACAAGAALKIATLSGHLLSRTRLPAGQGVAARIATVSVRGGAI